MINQLQVALVQASDPRKIALLLTLLLTILAIAGCGDIIPACPSSGSSGGCTTG